MICSVEPAFGRSGASGVEIAGAPGLSNSVLTRNAARKMFKTNIAPRRSRAERGHDGRAVRTPERVWLTLVLPLSGSSKIPNPMPPVAPSRRGTDAPIFWCAQLPAGRNCIICQITALGTRLLSLTFPNETDPHSVAQPPKRGVGLQAPSVTKSRLLSRSRPDTANDLSRHLPRHILRSEIRMISSAQHPIIH